jgi:hypothetical protein
MRRGLVGHIASREQPGPCNVQAIGLEGAFGENLIMDPGEECKKLAHASFPMLTAKEGQLFPRMEWNLLAPRIYDTYS